MKLHEIENLTASELKDRKPELIEAAKLASVDDLAARYVQARTDAKLRDESLAEQAKTLEALRTGLEAAKQQAEATGAELMKWTESAGQLGVALELAKATLLHQEETITTLKQDLATVQQQELISTTDWKRVSKEIGELDVVVLNTEKYRVAETERADRLKATATRHHHAVSSAAKLLNDALAAETIDNADTGE